MTDKKPYLAKLTGRGLDGTGVTDAIARRFVLAKGNRYMAVIEVEVHTIHDKPEQMIADLAVEQFWPIVDDRDLDERLRNLAAALHVRRGNPDGDPELELDGPAPKISDVVAGLQQHAAHPYISSGLAVDDEAPCDVCGLHEDAAQHRAANPPADDENDDEDDVDELEHNHFGDTDCSPGCPVYDAADDLLNAPA